MSTVSIRNSIIYVSVNTDCNCSEYQTLPLCETPVVPVWNLILYVSANIGCICTESRLYLYRISSCPYLRISSVFVQNLVIYVFENIVCICTESRNLCPWKILAVCCTESRNFHPCKYLSSLKFNADLFRVFTKVKIYILYIYCRLMQLLSKNMSHFMCKDYSVQFL